MGFGATGIAIRASAVSIALVVLAACTTHVPLSDDYRGPDAWPSDEPMALRGVAAAAVRGGRRRRSTNARALRRAPALAAVRRRFRRSDRVRVLRRRRRRAHAGRRVAARFQRAAQDSAFLRALLRESRVGRRRRDARPRSARRSDRARRARCETTCRIIAACSTGSSASPSSTLANRRVRRQPGRDGRRHADCSRSRA